MMLAPKAFTSTNAQANMKMKVIVESADAELGPDWICFTTRIERVDVPLAPPVRIAGRSYMRSVSSDRKGGFDQWQHDPPEPLPCASPVDLGRLVELVRNALQPGQDEQRHEWGRLPGVGDNDGDSSRPFLRPDDVVVEDAVCDAARRVDDLPQLGADGGRDRPRNEDRGPHDSAALERLVHHQRHDHADDGLEGDRHDRDAEGKSHRRPEFGCECAGRAFHRAAPRRRALLQQPGLVIGEAGEPTALVEEARGGIQAPILLERADDRLDDRIPDDKRQQEDRGSYQEEGQPTLTGSDLLPALLRPIAFYQLLFLG